jgi:eukaryotic-like serine/threonine-protein kinase
MSDTPENILISPTLISGSSPQVPGGPPANDPLPGTQLGEYVVEKAVAWGGMGIVYRAVHPLIGRKVAIKVLRPSFAADPEQMSRFLKEARAVAAIQHRGVIDIIGFGQIPDPDGRQYMVMEFLEGESLEAAMERERPMSAVRALGLVDEILDALSASHKAGVIHRDLKPANVYINKQSNGARYVKLVDFGLARVADVAELDRLSGRASMMAGTPQYVSPEQAKGLAATPRTDLYCLGVMLFEMVTGRLPFTGEGVLDLLNAHVNEVPPRAVTLVDGIPDAVDEFIARLLAKKPEVRPASAEQARQTVQRLMRGLREQETSATARPLAEPPPPPTVEKTRVVRREEVTARAEPVVVKATGPLPRKLPGWIWIAGAAGLALAIGGAVVLRSPAETSPMLEVPAPPPTTIPPGDPVALEPLIPMPPPEAPVPSAPAVAPAPKSRPHKSEPARAVTARSTEKGTLMVGVNVNGTRSWATVEIDGKSKRMEVPGELTLEAGPHRIKAFHPGAKPIEKKVITSSGANPVILFEFEK